MMKKIQSNLVLLEKLKTARLKTYTASDFKNYMVGEDEQDWWKRPKKDSVVYSFFVKVYCVQYKRLLERTFYVEQKWENKQKVSKSWEVQRTLAGIDQKLNRRVYYSMSSTIKVYTGDLPWYYHTSKGITPDTWEVVGMNTRKVTDIVGYGYYSAPDVYTYNDFKFLLKETIHKYSGFEYTQDFTYGEIFKYLAMYDKHPQIEMISKMGLSYLLQQNLRVLRFSKTGYEVFGIEKQDIKRLQALKINLKEFRDNIEYIRKFDIKNLDEYKILTKLIDCKEYIPMSKQNFEYLSKHRSDAYLYRDYLRFCNTLAIPLTHAVKYPDDIRKTHDELSKKITIIASKEKDKLIQKRVNKDLKKFRWYHDGLIITPANSTVDLMEESNILSHCVKTYVDSYAKGDTNIFLIRKKSNVNEPYFTLELRDKKIVQCRGKHNCAPGDDVKELVKEWANKFKLEGAYS